MANAKKKNSWVSKVKTDSTHPQAGLFTKNAETIARALASKKVSPKGPGSGMRMLTYFINRAGHNLPASRRAELEKAKTLLSKRLQREKKGSCEKSGVRGLPIILPGAVDHFSLLRAELPSTEDSGCRSTGPTRCDL